MATQSIRVGSLSKTRLRETNAVRKPARIAYAETRIYARRQALTCSEEANKEREVLNDATEQLQNDRARQF
jgi:hypothetical protein